MKKTLLSNAKDLRKNLTEAEKLLWKHLRAKHMNGYKFRRQHPLGRYIADFICLEKKLVIELDGGQHVLAKEKDLTREKWFYNEGFEILRLWNTEVFHNVEGVLEAIEKMCN